MKTKMNFIRLSVLAILAVVFLGSCASVRITHNYPDHIVGQLSKLPQDFLNAKLVLDEERRTLVLEDPLTLTEFVAFMMLSKPLDPETYLTTEIFTTGAGARIVFKEHKRGEVILYVAMNLIYQDGAEYARVDSIYWDDRLRGDQRDLVTLEEKAEFAALVFLYLLLQ